jgi:hypothetical protein
MRVLYFRQDHRLLSIYLCHGKFRIITKLHITCSEKGSHKGTFNDLFRKQRHGRKLILLSFILGAVDVENLINNFFKTEQALSFH